MNPTDLTLEAAAYITSSGAANSGRIQDLTDPQKRRIASDLTAAMQTIYSIAPAIYRRVLSADFAAPVSAAITLTSGSDIVTTAHAFGEGCSLYVGGTMNEIHTEGGVKRLRFPYMGASGTQTAVFYDDAETLPADAAKVIGPVSIAGGCSLTKIENRGQAEEWRRRISAPTRYWVEPVIIGSSAKSVRVTGPLDPDITGEYAFIGYDSNGADQYSDGRGNILLRYIAEDLSAAWLLGKVEYMLDGSAWSYAGTYYPHDPSGVYSGAFDRGNATVTKIEQANTSSVLRLRLLPIPKAQTTISYEIEVIAPKFTVDDLGDDDAPSTKTLVVPENYHELLVRPIFLKFWTGSPWYKGDADQRKRIAEDDQSARIFLKEYRPQPSGTRTIRAPL